jgi:two-component system, NarL family, response regulator LiaR
METSKAQSDPIRVLVVDDHEMVRRGLAVFLDAFDDMTLVGEASSGEEAVELCERLAPDVVLMDLILPGIDGLAATRMIRERSPGTQVLALTSYKEEELVQAALQAGAIGYLLKNATIDELAQAIRAAHAGRSTLAPEATQALIDAATRPAVQTYNLSEREREVLSLVIKGMTNRQIAQQLSLSNSTVKFHVSSILAKLGVGSRTEAVSLALKQHLDI